jgi:streptogramin lyase
MRTENQVQGVLGQYALSDGTFIQNFNEPDGYSSPLFVAIDKGGHIWFTDSLSQRVGYLIPSTGKVVARTIGSSNAHPNDGPVIDGSQRVWFTEEFRSILAMWPASAFK